ncbi:MAG: hypothetical protein B7Z80_02140 [Rhodospirillales bacterium 20-64-7]|nr:MAG: hypothetical protein B7Z80_02140 [Rhodospirillales bacterium 20-64-7]HQT76151.1 YdcF family protein [Rhodopila sp.]
MKVNPRDPDAIIVIFGAAVRRDGTPSQTLRHRVAAAAEFGRRFNHPLFIPTGAKGRYGEAEAIVMAGLLQDAGYPPSSILREETGTDTFSSACAATRIIRRIVPAPVFACSSAYHLPRCLLLLRLAGIDARACPPPPVPAATRRWLRWYWRLRETPALPYDALLMIWQRARRRL